MNDLRAVHLCSHVALGRAKSAGTGGDRRMVALRDGLPDRLDGHRLWSREVRYPGTGGWLVRVLGGSRADAEASFL